MIRDVVRTLAIEAIKRRRVPRYEPDERSVLLVRPDHLGDLLFLRPALRRFRARMPGWKITLAVGPWSRSVIDDDPNVDDIVVIPFPGFDREGTSNRWQPYELLFQEAIRIGALRPRASVILRDDHWWGALLATRAGVPTVIGADRAEMHGLLTEAVSLTASHWVERNIELLEFAAGTLCGPFDERPVDPHVDPLTWNATSEDRAAATRLIESVGVERPFVVIHPGSGARVKLWPARRWARVAEALIADGLDVVLTGSQAEESYVRRIQWQSHAPVRSLAGRTSLRELAALFDQSLLVAGVDSGPLHLAVAVGRPTVQIYGPSNTATYGPWGDPKDHRVVSAGLRCPECGNLSLDRRAGAGCMVAVTVDDVLDTVRELLPR